MASNADSDKRQVSFPKLKYPALRDLYPKTAQQWIKSKNMQDGAEDLWRINDDLYDLTNFISKHPGGRSWISVTQGTDITELFETHHLKGVAERILPKYFVRKTSEPRNYHYTFYEDGFYKSLKEKVMEKLKEIPDEERKHSNELTDFLLCVFIVMIPLTARVWTDDNRILGTTLFFATAYVMSALTTCAHNYIHQMDNWRMYIINITGMTHDDWRITHAMSHHMHTNTAQDLDLSMLEPILLFIPYKTKRIIQQMALFYYPIVLMTIFLAFLVKEVCTSVTNFEGKKFTWGTLVPFMVPTWIWLTGGLSLMGVILLWIALLMMSSFIFHIYAFSAGHYSSSVFFEGDVPRQEDLDWGLHQLDTVVERIDFAGDVFKSLTRFGDHALHHLFPTIDHAILHHLYPVLFEHLEKFETTLRTTTFTAAVWDSTQQFIRKTPHNLTIQKTLTKP